MDNGSTPKPPWDSLVFQQAPILDEATQDKLLRLTYDLSWNEIPHEHLNEVKMKIEPLEKGKQWEVLKKRTNPYELVYTQENSECPASISVLKPLSRSYFKMVEILTISNFFERIPKGTNKLRSAHVAEGPGGFIEAFLDRASFHRLQVSKVFGMTLKPTNNHIPGWRRAYNFLQRHPEIKIHYGLDGTGDLYLSQNQDSFIELMTTAKALLFTGDGGFDFSVDYENQEKSVFRLLIASVITGIQVLSPEGTLVLKLFDIFSAPTQLLLRCITYCFKDWILYKPSMSRPCNSERYLICRGFRRLNPTVLTVLKEMERQAEQNRYCQLDYFSFFTEKETQYLLDHIQQFNQNQIENIEKTIRMQGSFHQSYDWKPQYTLAQQWCSQFRVPFTKPKV
jgi:23S rRNA U2552 (ribose-2'-O)-methylase RlmE/FtsJ